MKFYAAAPAIRCVRFGAFILEISSSVGKTACNAIPSSLVMQICRLNRREAGNVLTEITGLSSKVATLLS
jgi:hypothetical protein